MAANIEDNGPRGGNIENIDISLLDLFRIERGPFLFTSEIQYRRQWTMCVELS